MHYKISFAICFKLDQCKILLSGNGLKGQTTLIEKEASPAFSPLPQCFQKDFTSSVDRIRQNAGKIRQNIFMKISMDFYFITG